MTASRAPSLVERARRIIPAGARVLAGASGGPDSAALIVVLDALRLTGHLDLVVGHVHHGLRGDRADADRAAVRELARRCGVPFASRRRDARELARRRRRGLEEAARAARLEALEDMRAEAGCDLIALAHTRDDQAETLLLRLLRGTGPPGLSGMAPASGRIVRPLLGARRDELRRHLVAAAVPWRSDESNWGLEGRRARLRGALHRFDDELGGGVVEALARLGDLARAESALLDRLADVAHEEVAAPTGVAVPEHSLRAGPGGLGDLPMPLARRLLHRLGARSSPGRQPPDRRTVDALVRLATEPSEGDVSRAGWAAVRRGDVLSLGPTRSVRAPDEPVAVALPGLTPWGDVGCLRATAWAKLPPACSAHRIALEGEGLPPRLVLRAIRPGDRFRPHAGSGAVRVERFLAERRVPPAERRRIPLVCGAGPGDNIIWVTGHGVAAGRSATSRTRRGVLLEWRPLATHGASS